MPPESDLRRLHLALLALLISASLLIASCRNAPNIADAGNGYKRMTVNNSVAHFSFEYPASYTEIEGPNTTDTADNRGSALYVFPPTRERPIIDPEPGGTRTVQMSYGPAELAIMAFDASQTPDLPAPVRMQRDLQALSSGWSRFKLLEHSTIEIQGVRAEYIVYEINPPFSSWPLAYQAVAYFDRGGLQWIITAKTDMDMAEEVRTAFQHVLETIKIYDK